MSFRFRKSIKLAPGIKLNLTSKGLSSLSVGRNGARVNIGKNGIRGTVGIPGSGLSYSSYAKYQSSPKGEDGWQSVEQVPEAPTTSPPKFLKAREQLVILVAGGFLVMLTAFGLSALRVQNEEAQYWADRQPASTAPNPIITPSATVENEFYQQALTKAMSAATLVQAASSQDDWGLVVNRWQASINLLGSITELDPYYDKAQTKIAEYQKNLAYAQTRMSHPSQSAPIAKTNSLSSKSVKPSVAINRNAVPTAPRVSSFGNCSSFATSAEAQASLAAGNYKLDRDRDGIACESSF
jgi:Protein of unknown function (DUF4236)/Excalibur calcium-binding domain